MGVGVDVGGSTIGVAGTYVGADVADGIGIAGTNGTQPVIINMTTQRARFNTVFIVFSLKTMTNGRSIEFRKIRKLT